MILQTSKAVLRRKIKNNFAFYTAEQLSEFSKQTISLLLQNKYLQNAETVLLFHPLPDEIQLLPLLQILSEEKNVLLPVIEAENMIPVKYHSAKTLRRGMFNIMEPHGEAFNGKIDVALIPGVAFDIQGHRLGRGKGYYDRFLCLFEGYKIGVCYPFQLFDNVPCEPHDIKMDTVVCFK